MIIIGYQGIGKSSSSGFYEGYIDLESSNFWVDGKRSEDWYKTYGNIALDLSRQGFNVFTSSHSVLRQYLAEHKELNDSICICYPAVYLKDEWIERLHQRYLNNQSDKNFKAWKNAEDRYEDNINEMITDADRYDFDKIEIESIDYRLSDVIKMKIGSHHLF